MARSVEISSNLAADLRVFKAMISGRISRESSASREDLLKEVISLVCIIFIIYVISI